MKKTFFGVCLLFMGFVAHGQDIVVAVAPFEALSGISGDDANTITEIYSIRLSAARAVRVVTREALDKVVREHGFQAGDWSDDQKTAALGEALNANWIVRGTLRKLGSNYVITASLLDIKSLQVMGGADMRISSIDDAYDSMGGFITQTVQTITGGSGGQAVITGRETAVSPAPSAAKEYKVGDRGPAGGWIFYDNGSVTNGWRYLEAAPVEAEFKAEWGAYEKNVSETTDGIGKGRDNTQIIVRYLQDIGEGGKAAQRCGSLDVGGCNDWFLPCKEELNLMHKNLKAKGIGGFSNDWYWSSSQYNYRTAWSQRFSNGSQGGNGKSNTYSVRAVRAF